MEHFLCTSNGSSLERGRHSGPIHRTLVKLLTNLDLFSSFVEAISVAYRTEPSTYRLPNSGMIVSVIVK